MSRWRGLEGFCGFFLWALLCACHTNNDAPASAGGGGGGFAPPTPPVVVNDVDGGLGGDARSAGGMGASPVVGGLDATPEALPDVLGRDTLVDRGPAADVPMVMACDLLTQNCGPSRGCYLDTSGQPVCTFAGDLGASAFCAEHRACLPGLLCVEAFGSGGGRTCQPVCNPARGDECPGGMGCRKLSGTTVGFCEP